MSLFGSLFWCLCTIIAVTATIQRYLPHLSLFQKDNQTNENNQWEYAVNQEISSGAEKAVPGDSSSSISVSIQMRKRWTFALLSALAALPCGALTVGTVDNWVAFARLLVAFVVLSCTAITDRELMIIPNTYVFLMIAARFGSLLLDLIYFREDAVARLVSSIIGAVICGLGLILVYVLTRGGIGFGDIKLFIGIGFLCGTYAVINTLIYSCLLTGIFSTVLLFTRKKGMKDALPMGPFIFWGYVITILFGAY